MNAKHLFLTLVAIVIGASYVWADKTTATDVISVSTITAKGYAGGLEDDDYNTPSDWTFESSATYASGSFFFSSGDGYIGIDNTYAFASTTSGGTVKSISIEWEDGFEPLNYDNGKYATLYVYARNSTPFTGAETTTTSGLPSLEQRHAFVYEDGVTTYNFTSDYEYIAVAALGEYGAYVRSISIVWEWEVFTYYTIGAGTITDGDWGTNVIASTTSAKEGDEVTITFAPKQAGKKPKIKKYSLTSYGFDGMTFDLSCASYITNPNTYDVKFPMPARNVTIDAVFEIISFTDPFVAIDGSVTEVQSALEATISFTHLDGDDNAIADYTASFITATSSDESVLTVDAPVKVSEGNYTFTVHGKATGTATISIDAASKGTVNSAHDEILLTVIPREVALVAQYSGGYYVMKNSLVDNMADAVQVYYDAVGDFFYYGNSENIDDFTWNAATPATNKYTIQNPNNSNKYLTYGDYLLSEESSSYQWGKNAYKKFTNSDKWGIVYDGTNFLADNTMENAAAEALIANFRPLSYSTVSGAGIVDARTLAPEDWGTICVPFNVSAASVATSGAKFYTLTGKHVEAETLVGVYLSDPVSVLEAGHSYFNPEESIDFNGNTAPFIQYTYARIQSVQRKAAERNQKSEIRSQILNDKEIALIQRLTEYPAVVKQAGDEFSPAVICNYAYALAQEYNSFYHDYSILNEADEQKKNLRLLLSAEVAKVLKHAMALLGIEMPNRM